MRSRVEAQTIVAMPENGSFAGGLINQDIGSLIWAIFANFDVVEVHAGFAQAIELDPAALVVAHRSDIFRAESEFRAGYQGGGHLSAGTDSLARERHLARVEPESAAGG